MPAAPLLALALLAPSAAPDAAPPNTRAPQVLRDEGPRRTFLGEVLAAKRRIHPEFLERCEQALRGDDAAEAYAVLLHEKEGRLRLPRETLVRTLAETRHRVVAKAAAMLLYKRGGPEAVRAFVAHVARRGPADDLCVELLPHTRTGAGREVLKERASSATAADRAGLLAIRAIALHPGKDIDVLLARLSRDWAPEVKAAAADAWELRRRAGLAAPAAPGPRTASDRGRAVPGVVVQPRTGREP